MSGRDYLNSVNLNRQAGQFPFLIMDVEKGRSVPEPPGFQVMHWHEDFQFILVYGGTIRLCTLSGEERLSRGEAAFINKNVVHRVATEPGHHYKSFLFPETLVGFYAGGPGSRGGAADFRMRTAAVSSLHARRALAEGNHREAEGSGASRKNSPGVL